MICPNGSSYRRIRAEKWMHGEVTLTARRVRMATLAVCGGYERMVVARRRAQEDAALAGAVARELTEAAVMVEAITPRRKRRLHEEEAAARRDVGEEGTGWLALG